MSITRLLALAAVSVCTTACYHLTVVTGAPEAAQTIDKPWQNSFISGLVPPAELETKSICQKGVAKVETEQSFLNGLVSALTGYAFVDIYSPIHVTVTCASGPVQRAAND